MDAQFHPLPPLKRVGLHQKRQHEFRKGTPCDVDFILPAKKRTQSRNVPANDQETTAFLLPTKKRVRALQPDCYGLTLISSSEEMADAAAANLIHSKCPDQQRGFMNLSISEDYGHYSLPAKKRKDTRNIVSAATAMFSMPNKKRVWAFQPDFVSRDMFDLNVEYKPSLGEDCKLESNFGTIEITESKTCEVVEELGKNDGLDYEENPAEAKISEGKEYVEFLDLEIVSKLGGGVHRTKSKTSEQVEDLGKNNTFDFEGSPPEAKSSEEKELVKGVELEFISNFDGVEITENKDSEVVEELGNDDEFDFELNQAEVVITEEKASVECLDLGSINKSNVGVHCFDGDLEKVTGFDGAIDGNGERGDLETVTNMVADDSECDNSLNVINFHVDGDTESEHLEKVTNSKNGGIEGDSESEDGIVCEICQSTDGDPSDPIVFCDGCDIMVHANCYGNPLIKGIPEGDWFCDKCTFIAEKPLKGISCCLCNSAGGGLKPTNDGRWAHIVCAVFVPEAFFGDPQGREGIDVSKICAKRWKKRCYICEERKGCVIDCSEAKCCLSFHVTCGLKEDLCIEYREGNSKKGGIVAGFCKDHTKLWKKQQQTGKFKIVAREER